MDSLSGQVSSCAVALPVARAAVSHRGRLVVIHPLRKGQADKIVLAILGRAAKARGASRPKVAISPRLGAAAVAKIKGATCIIVYRGHYRPGEVPGTGQQQGQYALMIVRVRHPAVLRAFLLDSLPSKL